MGEKGYVYVLTNPSFRDDWVKIGKSKRHSYLNYMSPISYRIQNKAFISA